MEKVGEAIVCQDCFEFLEIPEISGPIRDEVERGWDNLSSMVALSEHKKVHLYNWHYQGEENDIEFSSSHCGCCSSVLAGRRYVFICVV